MDDINKSIGGGNANEKRKIFIVFDDMIDDKVSNKKVNWVVTELFIRGRKLNISLVFITQSYFIEPNNVKLNCTHYFIINIPKRELRKIAFNHSSDIDFKNTLQKMNLKIIFFFRHWCFSCIR